MQVLLGGLDALADGLGNFLGLAGAVADHALTGIADDDERGEGHVLTALDDLGDAVDGDDLVLEVEAVRVDLFLHCHNVLSSFLAAYSGRLEGTLELESGFAGCVGESLDAAVIEITATIEDHLLDALLLARARR